jgi:hypothetical protein
VVEDLHKQDKGFLFSTTRNQKQKSSNIIHSLTVAYLLIVKGDDFEDTFKLFLAYAAIYFSILLYKEFLVWECAFKIFFNVSLPV